MTSCSGKDGKKEKQEAIEISDSLIKNMEVGVARITRVRGEIKLTGKISADQSKQLDVFPLVGGTVKEVSVELGDYVEKDKLMAVIKSGEAAEFEKQIIDAKSNYEVSK
ncbi:MAG: efflux RND transporter periplasmic adaptor subunit, partial [Bacteroidia bacterium]